MSLRSFAEYEAHCKKADNLIDRICESDTQIEFFPCDALSLSEFAALMHAGFLMMSAQDVNNSVTILLPKLHNVRAVLCPRDVHCGRTVKRLHSRYTLEIDMPLDDILKACVYTHGDDWLTPDLCSYLFALQKTPFPYIQIRCFGVYRDGVLRAGEFGIQVGRIYTSYSGFTREASAGSVQLYLTGLRLAKEGITMWDLGMPMEYKTYLGASGLSRECYISAFRAARDTFSDPELASCVGAPFE